MTFYYQRSYYFRNPLAATTATTRLVLHSFILGRFVEFSFGDFNESIRSRRDWNGAVCGLPRVRAWDGGVGNMALALPTPLVPQPYPSLPSLFLQLTEPNFIVKDKIYGCRSPLLHSPPWDTEFWIFVVDGISWTLLVIWAYLMQFTEEFSREIIQIKVSYHKFCSSCVIYVVLELNTESPSFAGQKPR